MRIIYAPRALRDIDEILAYIQKRSPRGAHRVSLAIERAIQLCALTPRATAQTDERIFHHAKVHITCAASRNHFLE